MSSLSISSLLFFRWCFLRPSWLPTICCILFHSLHRASILGLLLHLRSTGELHLLIPFGVIRLSLLTISPLPTICRHNLALDTTWCSQTVFISFVYCLQTKILVWYHLMQTPLLPSGMHDLLV
jgi:hypothetical protein